MFVGQYLHTLDDKKRLVLPAKFRDAFSANEEDRTAYTTIDSSDHGTCLVIHTAPAWQRLFERARNAAEQNEDAQWYFRKLCWDAEQCKLDSQWRLILPDRLIEAAKLQRDVMVVGGPSIEVWDVATWKELNQKLGQQAPQLRKKLYRPDADTKS